MAAGLGDVEAMRLVAEANQQRYVALRDFFLRLADDIFGLRQDFPDQGPVGAIRKHLILSENPLPEAVLSLSLQAVKDAVLGLLQPAQDSAELPNDQPDLPPITAETSLPPQSPPQTQPPPTQPPPTQPPPTQPPPTQPPPTQPPETPEAAGPSSGGVTTVPRPLKAPAAAAVLALLGGESAGRGFRVELVESLEPLRTRICNQRLPSFSVHRGSVAVVDTEVPNTALLLPSSLMGSAVAQPLRVTFRLGEERVMKTERMSGTDWDHRFAAEAVSVDGRVYVAGGIQSKKTLADVFVLDGSAGWGMPSMRTERVRHALLAFDGGLVAVGGLSGAKEPLASVEGLRLGEAGAEWRALPDLPRPLHSPGAAVFKGRLFVAGGATGRGVLTGVLSGVFSLGPRLDGWRAEGRLSHSRRSVCLVVVGGRLFALGGVCGPNASDESWARCVEVFEERDRRWRLLPDSLRIPVHRSLALPLS